MYLPITPYKGRTIMAKTTKLHELLAVEAGLKQTAHNVLDEAKITFAKRHEHFSGDVRSYTCKVEHDPSEVEEGIVDRNEIVTTVGDKLRYIMAPLGRFVDLMVTKDTANQVAVADIEIDEGIVISGVPVTTLLSMEDEIKKLRDVIAEIPTLAPGKSWIPAPDLGPEIFKMEHPEVKTRTRKVPRSHIEYEATKEHPAKVQTYMEDIPIGFYTTERTSGAITPADKSALLARVDTVFRAIKQARQRANSTEVAQRKIFYPIADYILKG